eukprot:TRINITY_DN58789_c0_g1_i1.p1 TRINITY_DN58789_c0_g1~~TRINITY_DN58789_c0_g1_i1.p1  ORF type:complete len:702 (-),score=134.39 TRINITY_DN58789_c0_g1_i1:39-2144(-)
MTECSARKQQGSPLKPSALDVDVDETMVTPPTTPGTTPASTPFGKTLQGHAAPLTAKGVASQPGDLPTCSLDTSLGEVADLLIATGHTAVVVSEKTGAFERLITEDDVLTGYLQGAPWDITVREWLRGGGGSSITASAPPSSAEQPIPPRSSNVEGRQGNHSPHEALQGFLSGSLGATSVADVMEPCASAPSLMPGQTMAQLLRGLLASPSRALLVAGEGGVCGLATASDALWGFKQQVCRSADAWARLSTRPGRIELEHYRISTEAPLQQAASALLRPPSASQETSTGILRSLVAVRPGDFEVVGMLSPSHFVQKRAAQQEADIKDEQQVESESDVTKSSVPKRRRQHKNLPNAVTVADIAAQRDAPVCSSDKTLADAADSLAGSGRTACVVVDSQGNLCGVLTENDLLQALVDGTSHGCSIAQWLRGGPARLPGFMVPALTLRASATVADACVEMAQQAQRDEGFACHHLLVRVGSADGGQSLDTTTNSSQAQSFRLLSALDLVRGMIDTVAAEASGAAGGAGGAAAVRASDLTVEVAMKDRMHAVASCKLSDTLDKAFQVMVDARQNCAIVVHGAAVGDPRLTGEFEQEQREHGHVHGIITADDALLAFMEHDRIQSTTVASWLQRFGCTDDEDEARVAGRRSIPCSASLSEAALAMAEFNVHHLLVVGPTGSKITGVISSLDIVQALAECYFNAMFD